MSLQDDYFDLAAYFEGEAPTKKGIDDLQDALDRIWEWSCNCEQECETLGDALTAVCKTVKIVEETK